MHDENVQAFEDLMDDAGLLPTDDGFTGEPDKPDTAAFEEHVEEFEDDTDDDSDADEGDEPAEEDEESDEGEESDADADADASEGEPQLFDITIEGEEYEVNLPELKAGYLRTEEFVKRSTELEATYSEKIAEAELRASELSRELEVVAVMGLAELRQLENIDWNALKAEDPEGYQAKRLEYVDKREAVQAQIQRKNSISQMAAQAEHLKHQAYLKDQTALVHKLIPEFSEPEFQPRLIKFAESIGFSPDEVTNIADARQLLVLENARKFAEGQLKKKAVITQKPRKELPPVLKPGSRPAPVDRGAKRQQAAVSRLRNEGTLDAAAAAFLDFV
ncbi:scaffolding protein [Pseudomonas phage SCYZ1]|nr:scaffolding protein [Pseudomonas phage SCYZ1]